jgi:hypothetical protein
MKAYTLEQLKLADDLAFPEDLKRLFLKHFGEMGLVLYLDAKRDGSLLTYIFKHSRHDLNVSYPKTMNDADGFTIIHVGLEAIIDELIGDKK